MKTFLVAVALEAVLISLGLFCLGWRGAVEQFNETRRFVARIVRRR